MSMQEKIRRLREETERLRQGGGEKAIQKRREQGKLTARERLELLFDPGTFTEIDLFVKHRGTEFGLDRKEIPADGVVTGWGLVDGRTVFAYSQDFTVQGGSLGEKHADKIVKVLEMALKAGAPFVGINDSGGARIQEGVDALNGYGKIFYRNTLASGVIPQLSVIMGPCAGGAVYSPGLTDFVFMVEGGSYMFITGPEVIKSVTGEDVTFEALGGAAAHMTRSGVAHFSAADEPSTLALVRRLLSFLPSNNMEDPPALDTGDPVDREESALADVVPVDPNKPYDVRDVIRPVLDGGDFFEVQPQWAMNMVVGFGRLGGRTVGIVANQPRVLAGTIDINASDKAARFIRFCDAFNIPLITFVDTPGYLPGTAQEHGGIIRHGAKLLYAYSEATVPKLTVVLRKAYGGAYLAMCSQSLGADFTVAWPTAEIAVMGADGAARILFKPSPDEGDPARALREWTAAYRERFNTPYMAAARGYVEAVIEPQATRPVLARALAALGTKRESRPARKHGNFPV
ncbi:acyl-CoA carboxylase subunit beta [Caldinitratiruptor microaerophilus]|uniref:Methylmalonyl-CoA carboxyltransferase n=1 Tax=Caldinitratiruptor microaerophilus TaxID=671077 RepID=A0AA35CLV3_9FIRM|nr:methylmalonyl-CoA carboxyltransferase [Caldinitratiruptor microaerophilus]